MPVGWLSGVSTENGRTFYWNPEVNAGANQWEDPRQEPTPSLERREIPLRLRPPVPLAPPGARQLARQPAPATTRMVAALSFLGADKIEAALQRELGDKPQGDALAAALVHCAGRGLIVAVHSILHRGADVNARGSRRQTALEVAVRNAHVKTCRALVSAGAARSDQVLEALRQLGATPGFKKEHASIGALLRR